MMKIVTIIPTYQRKYITIATVNYLKRQTIPLEAIIVVGSVQEDREAAEIADVIYVDYSNEFLSKKIQAGINRAREFNPDVLMICGSDDWLSLNWIEELSPYLKEFDIVGNGILYTLKCISKESIEITQLSAYKGTKRYGEPLGPGRMISKRILDKIDWQLYRRPLKMGMDGYSFAFMKSFGAKTFLYEIDEAKLLDFKGYWSRITDFERTQQKDNIIIPNPFDWMEENFSGVLQDVFLFANI